MNRPDFDELAELWQGEPDAAELAQFEASARKARRHGKLLGYLDYAFAMLLLAMVIVGSLVSVSPLTPLIGLPLMLAIAWITWKRRQVRQMTRALDTLSPPAFIESSLRFARGKLRRATLTLAALPLVVPVALAFKVSLRTGGGPQEVWEAFLIWTHTPRAFLTVLALIVIAAFNLRSCFRSKAEIKRLEKLREGYEAEAEREE